MKSVERVLCMQIEAFSIGGARFLFFLTYFITLHLFLHGNFLLPHFLKVVFPQYIVHVFSNI